MTHILLSAKDDKEAKLLLEIAKRMNIKGRKLTADNLEDFGLANVINEGRTTKFVNAKSVLKKLRNN